MPLPILLGLSSLGGGGAHHESLMLIRRLQGRGGYSEDEDGPRDQELRAWAEMHALGRNVLDRVGEQITPANATDLLEEWEAFLRVTNNAPRTEEERQIRAQRFRNLPTPADAVTLLALVDDIASGATIHTPTRQIVSTQGVTPECISHFVVLLSDAQYDDPEFRKLFDLLSRVVPARALGQVSRVGQTDEQVLTDLAALWDDGTQQLGRTGLHNTVNANQTQPRNAARWRDYGPLSRLTAADLNAVQEAVVFEGVVGTNENAADEDAAYRFFSADASSIGTTEVDTSIDWRDRLIVFVGRVSSADIRPEDGGDDQDGNDVGNEVTVPMYSGTGASGGSPGNYDAEIATNLYLRVDSSTGVLQLYNHTGATYFIHGAVIAGGDTGER